MSAFLPYLHNALASFRPIQSNDLEQQIHDHGTLDMSEKVCYGIGYRLQQLYHLLRLLIEERLVDLGKVAGLERIQWGRPFEEVPELPDERFVLYHCLVDGPRVGRQNFSSDVCVSVPLLVRLLLLVLSCPGRGTRPGERQQATLALVVILLRLLVRNRDGLELGRDDIFQQLLQDSVFAQVFDQPGIVLLKLLY